jgi:uncharacterized coiled-coil DUF342 family protein
MSKEKAIKLLDFAEKKYGGIQQYQIKSEEAFAFYNQVGELFQIIANAKRLLESDPEPTVSKETYDKLHIDYIERGREIDRLTAELKAKDERIADLEKDLPGFEEITGLLTEGEEMAKSKQQQINELRDEVTRLRGKVKEIQAWANAYPLVVFPKPNLKKAAEVLKAAGMTLDSISADNMRHVLDGIKDIVEKALKEGSR